MIEIVEEAGLPGIEVPTSVAPPTGPAIVAVVPDKEPGCWDRIKVYSNFFILCWVLLNFVFHRKNCVDGML